MLRSHRYLVYLWLYRIGKLNFSISFYWACSGRCYRYDGKYLEELTHKELPWVKARGNCKEDEVCDRIIPKNEIRDFFAQIKKSHKINSVDDLPRYVRSL